MNKALKALKRIRSCLRTRIDECDEDLDIIETVLKKIEEQDGVIQILKDVISFSKTLPYIKPNKEGGWDIMSAVEINIGRDIENKERELLRQWVLKECFPKELKALEIIKEKGIILQFIKETYTEDQYNAGVFGTLVKELTPEEYGLLKEELL